MCAHAYTRTERGGGAVSVGLRVRLRMCMFGQTASLCPSPMRNLSLCWNRAC